MEVRKTSENLAYEVLNKRLAERTVVDQHGRHGTTWDVFEENVKVALVGVGAKVLHNVLVLELPKEADLVFQSFDHVRLLMIHLGSTGYRRKLDLLDGHELTSNGMQRKVDTSERTLSDESALHVLDVVP